MSHTIPIAFTLITTRPPSYEQWIQDWTKQLLGPADKLRVPAEASRITTPLIVDKWHIMLAEYPNRSLTDFFISGIQEGFCVGFSPCGTQIKSAERNLHCAVEHPEVAESYLAEDVELGHISGPFPYQFAFILESHWPLKRLKIHPHHLPF